jgi:hypothetical protein
MRWNCFPDQTDIRFFPCMYKYMHLQLQFYPEMCQRLQKDKHICPYGRKYCEWKQKFVLKSLSKQMTNTEHFLCVHPPVTISCSHICKFRPRNITRISLVTVMYIPHMLPLYCLPHTRQVHGLYPIPADTPIPWECTASLTCSTISTGLSYPDTTQPSLSCNMKRPLDRLTDSLPSQRQSQFSADLSIRHITLQVHQHVGCEF